MTQKQTDYDKALLDCYNQMACRTDAPMASNTKDISAEFRYAYRMGYEYGRKQSTADHERNLIALGDDYMTARERVIEEGYTKYFKDEDNIGEEKYAYRQGWKDADTFDALWALKHPFYLLNRLLHDHPEIIEDEVKARMKDLENEKSDHFRDSAKMMRYEIAKDVAKALTHRLRVEHECGWSGDVNEQQIAHHSVALADALIKELGKEE